MIREKIKILNTDEILSASEDIMHLSVSYESAARRIFEIHQYPYQDTLNKVMNDAQAEWVYNQGYQRDLQENLFKNRSEL